MSETGFDETPEITSGLLEEFASAGFLNIAGGCCGTTPEHIAQIARAGRQVPAARAALPRHCRCRMTTQDEDEEVSLGKTARSGKGAALSTKSEPAPMKLSGLEPVLIGAGSLFVNVGERTNVTGSKAFARLILNGQFEEALGVARQQVENGAQVIDVNMDEAMLDSKAAMVRFLNLIAGEPEIARVPIMIDSSKWERDRGRPAMHPGQGHRQLDLDEGRRGPRSAHQAKLVRRYGAAAVVMAFDEKGQADTFERKTEICARAYRILVDEVGFPAEDIIFDPNIFAIATGIEEHDNYAVDFIDATRWIKQNLPGAKVTAASRT